VARKLLLRGQWHNDLQKSRQHKRRHLYRNILNQKHDTDFACVAAVKSRPVQKEVPCDFIILSSTNYEAYRLTR